MFAGDSGSGRDAVGGGDGVGGAEAAGASAGAATLDSIPPQCLGYGIWRRLVACARRFVGDNGEAEDIAQEVLLRAGAGLSTLRSQECVEAWLFRVCRHAAIDRRRVRRVRRAFWMQMPDDASEQVAHDQRPAAEPEHAETGHFDGELRRLPAHHRVLMHLHYERGLSQAAICQLTGLSTSAVRVRLFRARGTLAERVPVRGMSAQPA